MNPTPATATAMTSSKKAVAMAVKRADVRQRITTLAERLRQAVEMPH